MSLFDSLYKVPLILLSHLPLLVSIAMHKPHVPLSCIRRAILTEEDSLSMHHACAPFPLVHFSLHTDPPALALAAILPPLPLVYSSITLNHPAQPVSLTVPPLAVIHTTVFILNVLVSPLSLLPLFHHNLR